MKFNKRTTFYPEREVQKVLAKAEPKKVSERINELILKGLTKEKDEEIKANYEKYALALSQTTDPRTKDQHDTSTTMMMASGLFTPEEEPEDWF